MKGIFNVAAFAIVWGAAIFFTLGLALIPLGVVLFLTYAGAETRAAKAERIVQTTLMAGEQLISQTIQHRVFALWHRREVLAITDSRVILVRRGMIGGFKMSDIQWKDLKDVTIEQNVMDSICGSNLRFDHLNPAVPAMAMDGVRSEVASTMYARAQSEEQAWEEKRRVRAMEEVRAAAGGVVVHAPSPQSSGASGGNRMLDEIQRAKKLLDDGVISDAEFQEMKSKILASA